MRQHVFKPTTLNHDKEAQIAPCKAMLAVHLKFQNKTTTLQYDPQFKIASIPCCCSCARLCVTTHSQTRHTQQGQTGSYCCMQSSISSSLKVSDTRHPPPNMTLSEHLFSSNRVPSSMHVPVMFHTKDHMTSVNISFHKQQHARRRPPKKVKKESNKPPIWP